MLTSLDASQTTGQKIDVAVALTEALITGIAKGRSDYKLVGSYVRTSLNWAVITGTDPAADKYQSFDDLPGTEIGISRIGSGSQIMASVMALQRGWDLGQQIRFKVNDTFAQLRDGVNQKQGLETSCFMWEWYTTKPFVDSGEVRFSGNVPTPWPSWTIAASTNTALSASHKATLVAFLEKLHESIQTFANPETRSQGSAAEFIIQHHNYKPEDVASWLETVRWAGESTANPQNIAVPNVGQNTTTLSVSRATITSTLEVLEKAGVVNGPFNPSLFVDEPQRLVE